MGSLPTWTGSKKIGIAQPASKDDLTYIGLSGLGNAFSQFTKSSAPLDIGTTSYEYWLSNDVQGGDTISGSSINFR